MDQCEDYYMVARGFPNDLRVLAVDDDACSLKMLERLLLECGYKVTVAQHAHDALKLLRENKEIYDLVISDVNMPEMDGFKLLEIVGLEMDLPVIMLSVDCDVKSVMKGIIHGAVDYLVKPVRIEELKIIWKHVAKKSLNRMKGSNDPRNKLDHAGTAQDVHDSRPLKNFKSCEKEKDYNDSSDTDDEATAQKKPRVTWTAELHTEFINAVNQLGLDRAVPKKILDIMNIPGLSRENVASHLQKYRRGLKRNGMGLSEHFDTDAGPSGYYGSSDFLTINSRRPAISYENFGINGCKAMPQTSAYFPAQQSHNVHAALPPPWSARPYHQQNDSGRKYAISTDSSQVVIGRQHSTNSQTNQLITENPGLIPNSFVMNAPTQESNDSSYRFFIPRPNQLNFYAQTSQIPSPSDKNFCLSSAHPLEYAEGRQTCTLFDNIHFERRDADDSSSVELNTMLPSEQKQQQFSACSVVDVEEMGALFNVDCLDAYGNINEKLNRRSPSDLKIATGENFQEIIASLNDVEYEDDLHAALRQFRS